jgi:hypothetical protein
MNKMTKGSVVLTLGLVSAVGALQAAQIDLSKLPPASSQPGVTFEKDIRPLFEASCVRCHGAEKPKGGLRLDSREAVLKGGKEGKVVVPGNSEKSQLVISVARIDPESAMPPKPRPPRKGKGPNGAAQAPGAATKEGGTNQPPQKPMGPPPKPLTPEEVGLVRAWIDQGAK